MPPLLSHARAFVIALALAVTCVTVPACTSADADSPSEADCQRMRVHMIDLQIAREAKPGDKHRSAHLAKHRQIRLAANQSAALARCQRDLSSEHITCALAATSLDQYRACGQE